MAEQGSDNSNKVVIELDLETKNFQVKLGQVEQGVGSIAKKGSAGFSSMQIATIAFNQALELVERGIRGIEYAIDTMEAAEKIRNQTVALDNLAKSVGLNSKVLVESIKSASGGSLTQIEAQRLAFEGLNAGIQAKAIPNLVQLANKMSDAGLTTKSTAEVVHAFTQAIERGSTKGLKEFGISSDISGSRMAVLNAIMTDGGRQVKVLGDNFDSSAGRMKASFYDAMSGIGKSITGMFTKIGVELSKSPLEKASEQVKSLEKELETLKGATGKGWDYLRMTKGYSAYLTQAEHVAKIEKELEERRAKLNELTGKAAKIEEDRAKELEKAEEVEKNLTAEEVKRVELSAQVISAQQNISAEQSKSGQASLRSIEEYKRARKTQIDREAEDERELARSVATSRGQLMGKLIDIEERRRKKTQEIAMSEDVMRQQRSDTERAWLEQNVAEEEGAYDRLKEMKIAKENEEYQRKLANISLKKQDEASYRADVERAEIEHQNNLKNIKDQYNAVNSANFKAGVNSSLAQMKSQYGSFSTIVSRGMMRTQNIMTNSFVAAAKGHGNAMELMKQQFLEMIGTEMIQSGTFYVLKGIATADPTSIGAGSALIAAGMAIVSASAAGAPSGGGEGGGGGYAGAPYGTEPGMAKQEQLERKSAQIVIQGDYLNSRDTANHLAEVLRQNSDVTDYAIVAQGRQYA